jgi:hypothetical protein
VRTYTRNEELIELANHLAQKLANATVQRLRAVQGHQAGEELGIPAGCLGAVIHIVRTSETPASFHQFVRMLPALDRISPQNRENPLGHYAALSEILLEFLKGHGIEEIDEAHYLLAWTRRLAGPPRSGLERGGRTSRRYEEAGSTGMTSTTAAAAAGLRLLGTPQGLPGLSSKKPKEVTTRIVVVAFAKLRAGKPPLVETDDGSKIPCSKLPTYPLLKPGDRFSARVTFEDGKPVSAVFSPPRS